MFDWLRSITPVQSFAAMSIYVAGLTLLGIGALFGLNKGGHAMTPASTTIEIPIPAVDAAAPSNTETATFSLG